MTYFEKWKQKQIISDSVKRYQHFDSPVDLRKVKHCTKVLHEIKNIRSHQFLPFIKIVKKKIKFTLAKDTGNKVRTVKPRGIMYASHLDSHIYSYYNFILYSKYEQFLFKKGIEDKVIAYRRVENRTSGKGKSNIDFAKDVFEYIDELGECTVVTQDITSFFDNLNHKLLKKYLMDVLRVSFLPDDWQKIFHSLTRYRYVDHKDDFIKKRLKSKIQKEPNVPIYKHLKGIFKENKKDIGIPQGSPMSGLLANIYLAYFDCWINKKYPDVFYRRYSDDILFVCKKTMDMSVFMKEINQKISEYKIEIQPKKTYVTKFCMIARELCVCEVMHGNKIVGRDYLDYLGFEFDGTNVRFRKSTIQKFNVRERNRILRKVKQFDPEENKGKNKITKKNKIGSKISFNRDEYYNRSIESFGSISLVSQRKQMYKNKRKIKRKEKNK